MLEVIFKVRETNFKVPKAISKLLKSISKVLKSIFNVLKVEVTKIPSVPFVSQVIKMREIVPKSMPPGGAQLAHDPKRSPTSVPSVGML